MRYCPRCIIYTNIVLHIGDENVHDFERPCCDRRCRRVYLCMFLICSSQFCYRKIAQNPCPVLDTGDERKSKFTNYFYTSIIHLLYVLCLPLRQQSYRQRPSHILRCNTVTTICTDIVSKMSTASSIFILITTNDT